ncbi:hypothetical protein C7H85_18270 [Zobellella endophytica]|uniref:Phage shock protein A n=1 Tax=Zobellella endophytica TaxID=2116700 RepID=A0A2P7QTY9_9GAMM|nr:hypothetical protein [Zobellella endophytica]PSJ41419.1 hypothetical protein C7H85_18270 [Zobellella endophytica]
MSVLGQVLRSLQDPRDGSLDPDRVCVQLVRDCRHAEQHMQGLARQRDQQQQDIDELRQQQQQQQQFLAGQELQVLQALTEGDRPRALRLAIQVARWEDRQEQGLAALAVARKRLRYYQDRWLGAERQYHDLCRQLAMAKTTACVRKTMAAIRRHPAVTLVNAKQALADIRARERRQAADSLPEEAQATFCPHSAEQVLARLQQRLDPRP